MISNGLKNWQQSRGYRIGGDVVYGVYQGVGFSVSEEDGGKLFIFMLSGPDAAFDDIEDLLGTQRGDLRTVEVGDVETYLALFFDESGGDMPDHTMDDLLDFVADNCRACGFSAPNVCIKCGAPANKRSFVDNMVQPMCAQCRAAEKSGGAPARAQEPAYAPAPVAPPAPRRYEEDRYSDYDDRARDDYYDDRRDYPDEGNSGSGTLGAIVGAIAGLTFYFISVLIPLELAALSCVSGIASCLGYISFGGRKDKGTAMTTTMVSSLLLSILSVLAVKALNNIQGSFGETMSYLFSNLPWVSLVLAILGAVLGVSVCLSRILYYVKGDRD